MVVFIPHPLSPSSAAALDVGLPVCRNDAAGEDQKEKDNPVDGPISGGESEERGMSVEETVRDIPCPQKAEDVEKWPDTECQEAKVIGLSQIKRFFKVIRAISFSDGRVSPAPVFALLGDLQPHHSGRQADRHPRRQHPPVASGINSLPLTVHILKTPSPFQRYPPLQQRPVQQP